MQAKISAPSLLRTAARDLLRPPFALLLVVSMLATLATAPIADDDTLAIVSALIIGLVGAYASIAITLAASASPPETSADAWIRTAFKRRCLFRTAFAGLFTTFLVAAGLLALVVGGFIVGAAIGLATISTVLENVGPGDAIRRSIELSRPARKQIGVIYGTLVLVPTIGLQVAFYLADPDSVWFLAGMRGVSLLLFCVADIALTRAFLELGGKVLPRNERPTAPVAH